MTTTPIRILLLGKNGQVGWELQRALAPLGELLALDRHGEASGSAAGTNAVPSTNSAHYCGDLARPQALVETVRAFKPHVIVNAAAHTAVDKAESEPLVAHALNTTAPALLAREAAALGAWLVHYSTDYVFDGSGHLPRDEDAATAPLSVYGRSKLEGELAIVASGCKHLIFRTSWVYAARGGNFAKTMMRLAAERAELKVIDDQHGAPTGADLIADVTALALRTVLSKEPAADAPPAGQDKSRPTHDTDKHVERVEPQAAAAHDSSNDRGHYSGIYHLVAAGETTWHGYASFVIAKARAAGFPVKVADNAILTVPTSAFPTPARRPLNSRLSTARLSERFALRLPQWQAGVERMLAELPPPLPAPAAPLTAPTPEASKT